MSGIIGGAGSKSGVIGETELDYEEGTWTPLFADAASGGNTQAGHTGTSGEYTKVGRAVTITALAYVNTLGSLDGDIYIRNLPFTTGHYATIPINGVDLNIDAGETPIGYVGHGVDYITMKLYDSAAGSTPLHSTELSSDGDFYFSFVYHTA